jgi:hypothetical protein
MKPAEMGTLPKIYRKAETITMRVKFLLAFSSAVNIVFLLSVFFATACALSVPNSDTFGSIYKIRK